VSPRHSLILGLATIGALPAFAQQPIAYVPTQGVSLSGSLSVADGKASIGNNGSITAGDDTAHITLARGGQLLVCTTTKVHLSKDTSVGDTSDPGADSALMIALDRGALETNYTTGKYSDVLLTPDLRILISGPGQASLKIRVNQKGDTCVDNHGANAPYVTVTSQFEGGVYRVQPNQRVLFEHGSLQQVVDNEPEPCGCPVAPPPVSVADSGVTNHANPAHPGQPIGGPSSTPADTAFPLAESEGLKPPPTLPQQPVVPMGIPHIELQAPISYSSAATPDPKTPGAAGAEPASAVSAPLAPAAPPSTAPTTPAPAPPQTAPQAPADAPKPKKQGGFFHAIGHFFGKVFGR
jgi:hypothetical protein